jgi:APA family basic amino acid/polyamine antiporter
VFWGFGLGHGDWSNLAPFWSQRPGAEPLLSALGVGLIGAFFSFAGWWDASKIAGELRDPRRTLPRALVLGLSIVMVLYLAVNLVFLYLVSPDQIASDQDPSAFAALAGRALFGQIGEVVFAAVVVLSVAGSLTAVLMAFPRVYYAMGQDGLFFPSLAAVNPRRGTPARAIAIQAILASALALTGNFEQILSYFLTPTLVFLTWTIAAVFSFHRRLRSTAEPALDVPGYPISPLLFLIPVLAVIVLQILRDPLRPAIGLLVVVLGVPVSAWVLAQQRSAGKASAPPPAPGDRSSVSTIGPNS